MVSDNGRYIDSSGTCHQACEVFSRVVGYYRPISNWNKGKVEEFKERKEFTAGKAFAGKFIKK